jgi:hypothetical protein
MSEEDSVVSRMQAYIDDWEKAGDRRLIFLSCYELMTRNMLAALDAGDFEDNAWVNALLERFAGYYFTALEAYDREETVPVVWKLAFTAAQRPMSHVLQDLMLGINAHISYDLVFALADMLIPEWPNLSPEQRLSRYHDHFHVNEVINHTINSVQDQVVDRFSPGMRLVDKLMGPVDEWMTAWFISDWREEVWKNANLLVESSDEMDREALRKKVEEHSVERAHALLGEEGFTGLMNLL